MGFKGSSPMLQGGKGATRPRIQVSGERDGIEFNPWSLEETRVLPPAAVEVLDDAAASRIASGLQLAGV